MQLGFKIDTFTPIFIRSFVKYKHNKGVGQQSFFFLMSYP